MPDDKKPGDDNVGKQMGMLGLGLQLAVTVAIFFAAGWYADEHWGWAPWGKQGLSIFGIALGLYMFVKAAIK
jgi:hypothetical protein